MKKILETYPLGLYIVDLAQMVRTERTCKKMSSLMPRRYEIMRWYKEYQQNSEPDMGQHIREMLEVGAIRLLIDTLLEEWLEMAESVYNYL